MGMTNYIQMDHTVVVSLTFSTDLVITFSFLLAALGGTDIAGDDAVASSGTSFAWKPVKKKFFQIDKTFTTEKSDIMVKSEVKICNSLE
jgi:hypothetical protein